MGGERGGWESLRKGGRESEESLIGRKDGSGEMGRLKEGKGSCYGFSLT